MGVYRLVVHVNYSKDWKNSFTGFWNAVKELKKVAFDTPKPGLLSIEDNTQIADILGLAKEYNIQVKIVPDNSI